MVERHVQEAIAALLQELRVFEPPPEFAATANVTDPGIIERARSDPDAWWESQAERLDWFERWQSVLEWTPPHHRWFTGAD